MYGAEAAAPTMYQPGPMPWERGGNTPFRQFATDVLPNTYFRVEYLSWSLDDVGSRALGAPTLLQNGDVLHPIPQAVFDTDLFTARNLNVPRTGPFSFNKTSGARVTWGIPLTFGDLEFSGFALEENKDGLLNSIPGRAIPTNFVVPGGTVLTVPATVPTLTFPVGVTTTAVPMTTVRVFSPPATAGNPVTLPVGLFDTILPGTTLQIPTSNAIAIPLLQNGQKSTTALIYNLSYKASYHSQLWGTEAKLVLDVGPDHDGMTMKPLVGFRYLNFDEQFRQVGVTNYATNIVRTTPLYVGSTPAFLPPGQSVSLFGPVRQSIIDSTAQNNLYGLQLGTRMEYEYKRLALGLDPRVSLGVNHYETQVTTTNLRSLADGRHRTRDNELIFSPVFDVSMYGRLRVTPYFSLHAGYNFTYLFRVTRPVDNIVYNDNGPAAAPGVVVDPKTGSVSLQGLTVGGEIRFRDLKFR